MTGRHILVVDDDAQIRALLRRALERQGFLVVEAESTATALAHLREKAVALATLDLGLGDESGLELARRIRRDHDIPIIVLTGNGKEIDGLVGPGLTADDYLEKPFKLDNLIAKVRAALSKPKSTGS